MRYMEKKRFDGTWHPMTSNMGIEKERPTGNGEFAIRCLKPIAKEHEHLSLDELQKIYGTQG